MLFTKISKNQGKSGEPLEAITTAYLKLSNELKAIKKFHFISVHGAKAGDFIRRVDLMEDITKHQAEAAFLSVIRFTEQCSNFLFKGDYAYTVLMRCKGKDCGHELYILESKKGVLTEQRYTDTVKNFLEYKLGARDTVMFETGNDVLYDNWTI